MRNLTTNYTFTAGTRSITVAGEAFTVENIRLIVNETQIVPICSSMQKKNVSVTNNVITYTDTLPALQAELDGKVDDSQVLTNVPSGALFTDTVYTHPATHEATIIEQDATHRFVTDTEKTTWSGKAEGTHNHDDRYYTEGEIDTIKNDLLNLIYAGL